MEACLWIANCDCPGKACSPEKKDSRVHLITPSAEVFDVSRSGKMKLAHQQGDQITRCALLRDHFPIIHHLHRIHQTKR